MLRATASSLGSLVALAAGRAAFLLLVSNLFGAKLLGVIALTMSLMMLLALVLDLGAASSVVRLTAREPALAQGLRANALILAATSLTLAFPILLALYQLLGESVFADFGALSRVSLPFLVAAQVLQLGLQGIYVGRSEFLTVTQGHLIQYGVLGLGTVGCSVAELDGQLLLPLYLLSLLCKSWYWARRVETIESRVSWRRRLALLRRQVREGVHMMAGSLANLINFRVDALILAYFVPTRQVGLYAAAVTLAEATLYLPRGVAQAAFPWASAASGQRRQQFPLKQIRRMTLALAATAVVVSTLFILIAPMIIPPIFGQEFRAAVPSARVLLVAAVFNGLGMLAMSVLYGVGRADLNTGAGVLAAIANVVANFMLIPRFGILGAAYASCGSYALYFAATQLLLRWVTRNPAGEVRS